MDKVSKTARNILKIIDKPACVVDSDLTVLYANGEFKNMIAHGTGNKKTNLTKHLKKTSSIKRTTRKAVLNRSSAKCKNLIVISKNMEEIMTTAQITPVSIFSPNNKSLVISFDFKKKTTPEVTLLRKELLNARQKLKESEFYNFKLNNIIDEKKNKLGKARSELETVKEILANEMETAKKVQAKLLPGKHYDIPNLEIAVKYIPAGNVTGDMYDLIEIDDKRTAIFVFDVSGRGIQSSLIGITVKMLVTYYTKEFSEPSNILQRINNDVCDKISPGHRITAFLGIVDTSSNSLYYSQIGDNKAIMFINSKNKIKRLKNSNLFLGNSPTDSVKQFGDEIVSFNWNDKLLIYTDGLTSSSNSRNELYSSSRVAEILEKSGEASVESIIETIANDNSMFRHGYPILDDITVVCIERGCSDTILNESGFSREDEPSVLVVDSYDTIERSISSILSSLDSAGISDEIIFEIHQIANEVISNAVQHGNLFNPSKVVHVLYKIYDNKFVLSVIDQGKGFDHFDIESYITPDFTPYGKGFKLLHVLADTIEFNSKGNRIMLVKEFKETGVLSGYYKTN